MEADFCVVGAGVAGALIGYTLATRGHSVLVLDAGPRFTYPDMDSYQRMLRGGTPWPWEQANRDLYEDRSLPSASLNNHRIKAIGGTTLHWNANTQRLQPADLKMRTLFGLGADWPFDYQELEPWYLRAEQELGVSGGPAPGEPPRSAPYPQPAFPESYAEARFFSPAFRALGLPVGSNAAAINSQAYEGRPACAVFSTCLPMCPIHAKYTALHHIGKGEATGRMQVRPESHVRRIRLGSARRVSHVRFVDGTGQEMDATARYFVLAGGAIEIPRLLLLSGDDQHHPDGLANGSRQVGLNLMTHPRVIVRGMLPEPIGPHRNGYATTNCWALYQHEHLPRLGNVMLSPEVHSGPTPADLAMESGAWGDALLEQVRRSYGREGGMHVKGDMLPKPENRVALSSRLSDRFGDPAPVLEMNYGDFERHALDHGVETAIRLFHEMKATDIRTSGYSAVRSHLMGTTRMGDSADSSVCDQWGRCHELDNLYIASSSVFPTGGCSSPTLTIAALALRTAAHLADIA